MKKTVITIILVILCSLVMTVPKTVKGNTDFISSDIVLQFSGKYGKTSKDVIVKVMVKENSGINTATFTLNYNTDVFTFNGYNEGTALSKLGLLTFTSTTTPEDIEFKWSHKHGLLENDNGIGELVTLYFTVKESVDNGEYLITFNYDKDSSITYIDGNKQSQTKNAVIGGVKIIIKDNEIVDENSPKNQTKQTVFILIVVFLFVLFVVILVLYLIKRSKSKKTEKWIKL